MAAMTLAEVETKINALLENPKVDFKEGDVEVKNSQRLDQLLKYREHLMKNPTTPSLVTMHMNFDVNEFGEDQGEFED